MADNITTEIRKVDANVALTGIADNSPVGTFVFVILCFAFWAADIGLLGDGAQLGLGLLSLGVFVTYVCSGISLTHKGIGVGGNTYHLFGAVFGAIAGLFNTLGPIFAHFGIPFDGSIAGYAFTLAGLYLFFMLPGIARFTKIDFFIFFFGFLGVTGSGLVIIGILPAGFNVFNGWMLLCDGLVGFYAVIGTLLGNCGISIPFGSPFIKAKP
ncbi:MAG: hypothetical protein LBQ96_05930 [Fusobacteriaceae bacterium]|nr:hypothetical protein [Fusobacteriaceae bacterium]